MSRIELQRAYKFRLYPTPAQVAELSEWERQLRRLWNMAHEQRLASLARHLRPKSDVAECRSCGAPKLDATEHVPGCAGGGFLKKECQGWSSSHGRCGAKQIWKTDHTPYCAWVDYYRQGREMTEVVRADDQLSRVVCSARQEVLRDLERAWQRWRRAPQQWGKPHFKRRTDHCHIYFASPAYWKVAAGGGAKRGGELRWSTLTLTGMAASVGPIRIRQDRPWPEDAKFSSCHVVRDVGEWYAVFPLTFTANVERSKGGPVGINRGAVHAIADSQERVVDSPRYYARSMKIVQRRSRQLARKLPFGKKPPALAVKYRGLDPAVVDALAQELGTSPGKVVYEAKRRGGLDAAAAHLRAQPPAPRREALALPSEGRNRERAKVRLALSHQTIRRRREKFLHGESSYYARNFSRVAIERWSTRAMTSSAPEEPEERAEESSGTSPKQPKRRRVVRARNRSILDVGWYAFAKQLEYKLAAAGGEVVEIDPGLVETSTDPEVAALAQARGDEVDPDLLAGSAGISRTCSGCGSRLRDRASGHREALCAVCLKAEPGDVNAAKNALKRMLFPPEDAPVVVKKQKVTIGIKGKKRKVAA